MAFRSIAERKVIAATAVGTVMIALGGVLILTARDRAVFRFGYDNVDGALPYYIWDELQLAVGIIFAIVGAAAVSASLTYLLLNRKRKGV